MCDRCRKKPFVRHQLITAECLRIRRGDVYYERDIRCDFLLKNMRHTNNDGFDGGLEVFHGIIFVCCTRHNEGESEVSSQPDPEIPDPRGTHLSEQPYAG